MDTGGSHISRYPQTQVPLSEKHRCSDSCAGAQLERKPRCFRDFSQHLPDRESIYFALAALVAASADYFFGRASKLRILYAGS